MPNWTDAQQNAIDVRGGTVLVSAAAGSGKTAVLVERVIGLITDENNPVDIEQLLIVTFTKAAAAEMKMRIAKELRSKLKENPNNKNLIRQIAHLPNADICTIDSFCMNIVKENFYTLGIPSNFTLIEESDNDVIADNAINEVLEEKYLEKNPDFISLVQSLTKPDNDSNLISTIKRILKYIYAYPFPYSWLNSVIEYYNPNTDFKSSVWKEMLDERIESYLKTSKELSDRMVAATSALGKDDKLLINNINDDAEIIKKMITAFKSGTISDLNHASSIEFNRLTSSKKVDKEVKAEFKKIRAVYKGMVSDINSYCVSTEEEFKDDLNTLYPIYKELAQLIKSVDEKMRITKNEMASYSFSDIEHFAVDLLFFQDENGNIKKTKLGKELSDKYYEILVDEYQDTNEAQDKLFSYLSNGHNMFMVGDVKQSIYRFRLAMPGIFNEKKNTYTPYDKESEQFPAQITLDKNFRSRKGICDYVNQVFSLAMKPGASEINYTKNEHLINGAKYDFDDVDDENNIPCADIRILNNVEGKYIDEREPIYIAKTIKEIIASGRKIGSRSVNYGDIVILMRSISNHIGNYSKILTDYGIPVVCENKSNLFDNPEIILLNSYIRIIDNPLRDIELITILMSPIYGFTADDLADIRIKNPYEKNFYQSVIKSNNEKAKSFLQDITELRKIAVTMTVQNFIRYLIDKKGILSFCYAMGSGEQREENINILLGIAKRFDSGKNVGLTSFIRYLDSIINSDEKTPSAAVSPGNAKAVRIMSIHGSKGLEFPICILAGASRKYNINDIQQSLLIDPQLGIGTKCHNEEGYFKYTSIPLVCIKNNLKNAMSSENLRVLYVAMTRAKEQFISFITLSNVTKTVEKIAGSIIDNEPLPYTVSKVDNDAKLILTAALLHKGGKALRDLVDFKTVTESGYNMNVEIVENDELEEKAVAKKAEGKVDNVLLSEITEKLKFQYEYLPLSKISAKRSASDLDKTEHSMDFLTSSKPAFLLSGKMSSADKGTAMHRFMEKCDYVSASKSVTKEAERLKEQNLISTEQFDVLNIKSLESLFHGEFYDMLTNAVEVYREYKLSTFIDAADIDKTDSQEKVFVQGIADCIFDVGDSLVLVDYKTDRVKEESELTSRYEKQLMFYKVAAERMLEKPVNDVYLYSFYLSKLIKYKKY